MYFCQQVTGSFIHISFNIDIWRRPYFTQLHRFYAFNNIFSTWWLGNKSGCAKFNTFPDSEWRKIENDFSNPSQVPSRWDIIFFEGSSFHTLYWHVAIVVSAVNWENNIQVLEQNGVWSGTGIWKDSIRLQEYTYNGVSGWYSKK